MPERPLLPHPKDLVRIWAERDPERIALRTENESTVSYGALDKQIAALSARLQALGIGAGQQVALSFGNSVAFVVWISAVWRVEACAVTLDPRLSAREVNGLLSESGVDLCAGLPSLDPEKRVGWEPVDLGDDIPGQMWRRQTASGSPLVPPLPDTVLRRFSSGSTGTPKHVLLSAANLLEDYSHASAPMQLTDRERYLGVVPFFHAFGGLGLMEALAHGGEVLVMDRFMPGAFLTQARAFKPTFLHLTPPMIEALCNCYVDAEDLAAFSDARFVITATGRLAQTYYDSFAGRYGPPLINMFGSSETLSITLAVHGPAVEGRVGPPLPNVRIEILDDQGRALPPGETGKVAVHSPSNGVAFAGPDRLTAKGAPILTGDWGYLSDRGALFVVGRDDVINIGGYKVDRHEVEEVIRQALPVTYVAVVKTERGGQPALRAVIEADPAVVKPKAVIAACKAGLINYKVPARVEVYPELPRDANGKVRMASLQSLASTPGERSNG